jgi:hypothetical protein
MISKGARGSEPGQGVEDALILHLTMEPNLAIHACQTKTHVKSMTQPYMPT